MARFIFEGKISPIDSSVGGCGIIPILLVIAFILTSVVTIFYQSYRYFDYYMFGSKSCKDKYSTYNAPNLIPVVQCETINITMPSQSNLMQIETYGLSEFIPKKENINDRLEFGIFGDDYTKYELGVFKKLLDGSKGEYVTVLNVTRSKDRKHYTISPSENGKGEVIIEHLILELHYQ